MSKHWNPSTIRFLDKYVCIKHGITNEIAMTSKKGEVWQESATHCKAVVKGIERTNKVCSALGIPLKNRGLNKDDEYLISFPNDKIDLVIKALNIKANRNSQSDYANNF